MKRVLFLSSVLAAGLMMTPASHAQNAATAAAIADRLDMEERFKQITSALEGLQANHLALQKRLAEVTAEIKELREQTGKPAANSVTRDDLKILADKIVEVDKERERNNKLVIEKIGELGKVLNKPHVATPPPTARATNNQDTAAPQKGFEYTVEKGDTISKIIEAYRGNNIKVTAKQIEAANPGLNPTKLQIGQKIFIPAPNQ
ncbi:MAG: LysM peptidoglycan-binding domain-containing protein [Verrucomicrobiota bacterium]